MTLFDCQVGEKAEVLGVSGERAIRSRSAAAVMNYRCAKMKPKRLKSGGSADEF